MIINNNSNINFEAKFLKSESLKNVADYALEKGKFDKLNNARCNIDKAALTKRIKMDIIDKDGYPTVIFTKYEPRARSLGLSIDEYIPTKQIQRTSTKKMNPLKYALELIIKLGNNAPNNKMYRNLIFTRDINRSRFILDLE